MRGPATLDAEQAAAKGQAARDAVIKTSYQHKRGGASLIDSETGRNVLQQAASGVDAKPVALIAHGRTHETVDALSDRRNKFAHRNHSMAGSTALPAAALYGDGGTLQQFAKLEPLEKAAGPRGYRNKRKSTDPGVKIVANLVKNSQGGQLQVGRSRQTKAHAATFTPSATDPHSGDAKEGAANAAPKPASHHKMNPYLDDVDIPASVYGGSRNQQPARVQQQASATKDESPQRAMYSTAADSGFAG